MKLARLWCWARILVLQLQLTLATYNDKNAQKYAERVAHYESASDQTENAIADYLYDIDATPISNDLKNKIRDYLYLATEIESVADRCYNISRSVVRRNSENINFTEEQNKELNKMIYFFLRIFCIIS